MAPLRRIVAFRYAWLPPWGGGPVSLVLLPVLECGHGARWRAAALLPLPGGRFPRSRLLSGETLTPRP